MLYEVIYLYNYQSIYLVVLINVSIYMYQLTMGDPLHATSNARRLYLKSREYLEDSFAE